jgi:hypothetical protein
MVTEFTGPRLRFYDKDERSDREFTSGAIVATDVA